MSELIGLLIFIGLWMYGATRRGGHMGGIALFTVALVASVALPTRGSGASLTVYPVSLEMRGAPGAAVRGEITVVNNASEPGRFRAVATDVIEAREGDRMRFSVDPEFFTLPAKGRGVVEVSGIIPPDAKASKFGAVAVSAVPQFAPSVGNTVTAVPGIAVNMLVRVGEERIAGHLQSVAGRWRSERAEVRATFANTGTLYIRPIVRLVVLSATGREVSTADIPTLTVYPGTAREFYAVTGSLPLAPYTLRIVFEWGGSRLSVGEVRLP
jgi:hypothetical protein